MTFYLPRWARITILIVLALGLQWLVIRSLAANGVLDQIEPWDDVGYIYLGISNWVDLVAGHWAAVNIVHEPLALVPATLAAAIAPASDAAPYWTNAAYLAAIFVFVDSRIKGFIPALAFCFVLIGTPYLFGLTSQVKTDLHGGALFFILVAMMLDDANNAKLAWGQILWPGSLAWLIVLSKPAGFYIPELVCSVFVVAAVLDLSRRKGINTRGEIASHYLALIGITLLAQIAAVGPNLPYFVAYIVQALLPPWSHDYTLLQRLTTYLPFVSTDPITGMSFWGRNVAGYLLICVAFLWVLLRHPRQQFLASLGAFVVVAVFAFVPPIAGTNLAWSFASPFAGAMLALLFYLYATFIRAVRRPWAPALVLVAATAATFSLPARRLEQSAPPAVEARAMLDAFTKQIATVDHPRVLVPFLGFVPAFNFAIRLYRSTGTFPVLAELARRADQTQAIAAGRSNFDFVIFYDGPPESIPSWFDANTDLEEAQQRIADEWSPLAAVSRAAVGRGTYILYRVP